MVNVTRSIHSLLDESKHFKFQGAATKTVFKLHQKNEALQTALKNTSGENSDAEGRIKLFSQEAKGWKRRVN